MSEVPEKVIQDTRLGLHHVAEVLEEAYRVARVELRSLAKHLPASPNLDLMREQEIPWDLASYLHDQITDLAKPAGFREIEDPVAYLENLAEMTEEGLHQEFVSNRRESYERQ